MSSHPFPLPDPTEDESRIDFHAEDVPYPLHDEALLRQWIERVIEGAGCRLVQLNYIFCSDEYLYRLNVEYLDHDTYTDIITFPYAEPPLVHGDLFISVERVRENARELDVPFEDELHRVMIHGVWHLCGQGDKTPEEARAMRQREDEALQLLRHMQRSKA